MAGNRKQRRQQHGSAGHWKQTDAWYYTEPGTKKRVPLFDEKGERIRDKEHKEAIRTALARINVADELSTPVPPISDEWTVAKVGDVYSADLHRSANPQVTSGLNTMHWRSRHQRVRHKQGAVIPASKHIGSGVNEV